MQDNRVCRTIRFIDGGNWYTRHFIRPPNGSATRRQRRGLCVSVFPSRPRYLIHPRVPCAKSHSMAIVMVVAGTVTSARAAEFLLRTTRGQSHHTAKTIWKCTSHAKLQAFFSRSGWLMLLVRRTRAHIHTHASVNTHTHTRRPRTQTKTKNYT